MRRVAIYSAKIFFRRNKSVYLPFNDCNSLAKTGINNALRGHIFSQNLLSAGLIYGFDL